MRGTGAPQDEYQLMEVGLSGFCETQPTITVLTVFP